MLYPRGEAKQAGGAHFQKCAFLSGEGDGHGCKLRKVGELKWVPNHGPWHEYEGPKILDQEGECVCVRCFHSSKLP